MKKYNHVFTVEFTVFGSTDKEGNETAATLRVALQKIIDNLGDDELLVATGAPYTYEEEALKDWKYKVEKSREAYQRYIDSCDATDCHPVAYDEWCKV